MSRGRPGTRQQRDAKFQGLIIDPNARTEAEILESAWGFQTVKWVTREELEAIYPRKSNAQG